MNHLVYKDFLNSSMILEGKSLRAGLPLVLLKTSSCNDSYGTLVMITVLTSQQNTLGL